MSSTLERAEALEREQIVTLENKVVTRSILYTSGDYDPREPPPWRKAYGARMSSKYLSKDTIDLHEKLMNSLRHPVRLEQDLRKRVEFCDFVKLRFDDVQIDEFINLVRTFQSMSRRVEVILLPQNHQWVQNPPETKNRLNQILNRIRRETRATIKNYQKVPEINATHFSDTTHLTPMFGSELFTRILARDLNIVKIEDVVN